MNKTEQVYREILYCVLEKKKFAMTQLELSKRLNISISTVSHSLKALKKMGAINIHPMNFEIVNPKKILYYWAGIRNIQKDIIFEARIDRNAAEIEKLMPQDIIYAAYSAYKFKFRDIPADYSEVYVYSDEKTLNELKKRLDIKKTSANISNLFVLKKDENMDKYPRMTIANIFVDLWNIKEWYARDFLKAIEKEINKICGEQDD